MLNLKSTVAPSPFWDILFRISQKVYFSQYSPPVSLALPLLSVSVRPWVLPSYNYHFSEVVPNSVRFAVQYATVFGSPVKAVLPNKG